MKKALTTATKQLSWLPLGLERATKQAIRWAREPSDQSQSRRRALTLFAVPAGVIVAGVDYPVPAITGSFAVLVGLSAWYGYTEDDVMRVTEEDALPPYEVNGEVMTGREVLEVFLAAHRGESLTELAPLLGVDDPRELGFQIAAKGLKVPPLSSPSPAEEPVAEPQVEAPDHSPAEAEPEGAEDSPEGAVITTTDRGGIDSVHESGREEGHPAPEPGRLVPQQ